MRAKILLSVLALSAVGLAALPGDLIKRQSDAPVAFSTTQSTAALALSAAPTTPAGPQAAGMQPPATVAATPNAAFPPTGSELTTVGDSPLNVRQGPASSYAKLFVAQAGEKLAVLDKNGAWVQIQRPTGESGWVHSKYLEGGSQAEQSATPPASADNPGAGARRYVRLGSTSLLFASPSRSSQPLFRVNPGERLRISDYRGNWVRVTTADGLSGWLRVR